MKRFRTPWACVALAGLLAIGCEAREAGEEGAIEEETAAVEAPDIESAVQEMAAEFERAVEANDVEAVVAQYTEDAVVLAPGSEMVRGRDGIRAMYTEWLTNDPDAVIDLTTESVEVAESGDLAYEVGTARVSGTGPDGQPYEDAGKYVVVFRNVGGEWKVEADIWNSDTPMPGAEGAAPAETDAPPATEPEGEAGGA